MTKPLDLSLPDKVADMKLADFGRKEMQLSEREMPGLMECIRKYGPSKPLKGLKLSGSLHMTIQTAMLIKTLHALGADIRWASCTTSNLQGSRPSRRTRRRGPCPQRRPRQGPAWRRCCTRPSGCRPQGRAGS